MKKRKPSLTRKTTAKAKARRQWTGIAAAVMSALAALAALPYQLGEIATIIPPDLKASVTSVGLISALALRVINQTTDI